MQLRVRGGGKNRLEHPRKQRKDGDAQQGDGDALLIVRESWQERERPSKGVAGASSRWERSERSRAQEAECCSTTIAQGNTFGGHARTMLLRHLRMAAASS